MWTRSRLLASLVLLLAWLPVYSSHAQDGQYRSKILIDPGGLLEEGVAQTLDELEQQMDELSDPYAIAISGRQLAREYVQRKDYDKAVAWYNTALQAEGLSPVADRQLLRELAQVYLLQGNVEAAAPAMNRVLAFDLEVEANDYLLLADVRYRQGDYVGVVSALDTLRELDTALSEEQLQRSLALYYRAAAYAQSAEVLQALLVLRPEHATYWHQLAAVYLQQGKQQEALNQLLLARDKGVAFDADDTRLLADLLAAEGNPYGAAEVWSAALASGAVNNNGENYRLLFEFWLQAREQDKAITALIQAAQLTGDTELYLYLAQLYYAAEDWNEMRATVLKACEQELEDRYVSRANFLLGISQLKLGDQLQARRSFINATLIGGAGTDAARWLRYMEAEPVTAAEAKRIVSPCYGSGDKRQRADKEMMAAVAGGIADAETDQEAGSPVGSVVAVKTVQGQTVFSTAHTSSSAEAAEKALQLATQLVVALVRAGGEADGSLQLLFDWPPAAGDQSFTLALPVRGNPHSRGRYRVIEQRDFTCAYLEFEGTAETLEEAWRQLAQGSSEQGYTPSGEARIVFKKGAQEGAAFKAELQLGIE